MMMRRLVPCRLVVALIVVGLPLAACGSADGPAIATEPGPLMRPGWNCLASGCHFPDGRTPPPDWGAGGTVFERFYAPADQGVAGVAVTLRAANGTEVRLITNEAGNFYTPTTLPGPIDVTLEREGRTISMPMPAPAGSCNFCHAQPSIPDGPAGRIYAP
jgi:hypothetical protein